MATSDPNKEGDDIVNIRMSDSAYETLNLPNAYSTTRKQKDTIIYRAGMKRQKIILVLISVFIGYSIVVYGIARLAQTPFKNWELYRGHRYLFAKDEKSWRDAQDACKDEGANLVKIDNGTENNWLLSKVADTWTWVGANDIYREGHWKWVSDNSPLTYTNWAPDEPNNDHASGDENCVHFYAWNQEQKWNDYLCSKELQYVCEKD